MNSRLLYIVCGGTGGHLAPGIAVAQGWLKQGNRAMLLLSRKEVDARLIRDYPNLEWKALPSAPLSLNPLGLFRFVVQQLAGVFSCISLFRRKKPHMVLAFGGYTSFGPVVAAWALNIPVILHEANRKAGRAIRMLKHLAYRLYLPDGIRLGGVEPRRIRHPGFPVRDEIRALGREQARQKLELNPRGRWLVVLGGSQGATSLNRWVGEHFESLAEDGIHVFCLTGPGKGSRGTVETVASGGRPVSAVFVPFSADMGAVISAADLVISRAGAGTIAELIRCHKPSVLVPYPYAADNHQMENARFLERQGGCVVVPEDNLVSLRDEVRDLIYNDWMLDRLQGNLRNLDQKDSRDAIVGDLIALADDLDSGRAKMPNHSFLEVRLW